MGRPTATDRSRRRRAAACARAMGLFVASIVAVAGCTTAATTSPSGTLSGAPSASPAASPSAVATPHTTPLLLEPPAPTLTVTSSAEPSPTLTVTDSPSPSADAEPTSADPEIAEVRDRQWQRMVNTGTWRPGCPVGRDDLRRLEINFVNFDGGVQRGALVAHRDVVDDLSEIFSALFEKRFPIERMEPVEAYDGDVVRSLEANNTSAFNCRRPDQINAPVLQSPHANGRAIDINPYQNPWIDPRCSCWVPSDDFAKVRVGAGVITAESLPWKLFTTRGWIWQDIDVPDYMHFDTGFPSTPHAP